MAFPFDSANSLEHATSTTERTVHLFSFLLQAASGILAGVAIYEYLSLQDMNAVLAVVLSVLVGGMTFGALVSFTAATIKLLPRLRGELQLAGSACVIVGLLTFSAVSGTSNVTVLGYQAASMLDIQDELAEGQTAFQSVQTLSTKLGQILPMLRAGHEVAAKLRAHEETDGETGGGRGPIFSEIQSQETRLQTVQQDVAAYLSEAQSLTIDGQDTLDHIRASLKDDKLTPGQKKRALENGLTHLSTISIQLQQAMPLSSLRGVADMLTSPVTLTSYSDDPDKRRIQEQTLASLRSEFTPIGTALRKAIADIEEAGTPSVPVHTDKSPTAVVFAHASELWAVIGIAYSLDILPFLAVGIIMLACRQAADVDPTRIPPVPPRGPGRPKGSTNAKRREAQESERADDGDEQ